MSAKKPPAFQFYAGDYLSSEDVAMLTLAQEGIYIRLLAYDWKSGSVPADAKLAAALVGKGATPEDCAVVLALFKVSLGDGRLTHKRLVEQRAYQAEIRKKNSENASERQRRLREEREQRAAVKADGGLAPAPEASVKPKKRPAKAEEPMPEPPYSSDAYKAAWAGYLDMRKRKGKSPTPGAVRRIYADLTAWGEPAAIAALNASERAGWTDVYNKTAGGAGRSAFTPTRQASGKISTGIDYTT